MNFELLFQAKVETKFSFFNHINLLSLNQDDENNYLINQLSGTLEIVSAIFAFLPGLLNFPKAFDEAGGILVGIVVQASLIVFIVAALLILGK